MKQIKNSYAVVLTVCLVFIVSGHLCAEGSVFGFSMIVNDNDGNGRKRGITMGPAGTEPFQRPFIWRTVQLAAD